MSRPPARHNVHSNTSAFTSTKRILVITLGFILALGAVGLSKSVALRERLGLAGASKPAATVKHATLPVAPTRKVDLLRMVGVNRASRQPSHLASPFAPTVSATKTDSLLIDNDSDLQADPGDTLKYTVNINSSGDDATGVTFTDTVDPNTAFVPGSLRATPVAVDDSYAATGNIRISGAAPGVRGNDFAGVPSATVSAPSTSTNGGNVTVNNDGSFTYNPPAGFEGTDTFNYTLTNSEGSNSATVTINVSGMIWFIDNSSSCPCDGRLTNPFNSLASFQAVNNGAGNNPAANDNIFVYESATDYVGPVTLLSGQRFLGQDSTASLSAMTGISPPAGSDPLPTTNSANGVIVNITGGNAITVGSGNTLRGFTGGDSSTDISGIAFGTLTISDVTLNGTGQALNLTTGTLAATFGSISSTNSATTGVSLTTVGGSLTSPTTTVTNPGGIGVSVNGSSATLNFGDTTATASGGTGVSLLTNTGAFTFGALNISPDANQRGLEAIENSNTITSTSGAISASGARAVEITRSTLTTPLAIALTSVSASGDANGIYLANTSGSFAVNGDGTNLAVGGNSSGGTISGMSGADGAVAGSGVYLDNASNVALRRMTINGTNQNFGIRGFRVNNFTLEYSTVNGTNGTSPSFDNYGEGSVMFGDDASTTTNGMTGTGTITNCVFAGGRARNFSVVNTAGTLNRLTITGSTFGLNQNFLDAGSSLAVEARNAGTIVNVTVTGSTFTGSPGDEANFTGLTGTTMDVIFGGVTGTPGTAPGNAVSNNHAFNAIGGSNLTFASQGVMNFHTRGNTFRDADGSAITLFKANAGTQLNGFFDNNIIGVSGITNSGSETGNGIFVSAGGAGSMGYTITNNAIHEINGSAHIFADNTGGSYTANFTIEGNTLDTPGAGWFAGIAITNGAPSSTDTINVCAKIGGASAAEKNTFNLAGNLGVIVGSSGAAAGHVFNLPTYAGGANLTNVENFIQGNNQGSFSTLAYEDPPATAAAFTGTGTDCGTPLSLMATTASSDSMDSAVAQSNNRRKSDLSAGHDSVLRSALGQGPSDPNLQKLSQEELNFVIQAAIARWEETGISTDDLARLRAVTFEIADLPNSELASVAGTSVRIDQTGAGHGWFFDQSPNEDSEFDVSVPERELQTTELSLAHEGMDLLTVVMRELGVAFQQGKKSTAKQLRPLMENTLSPAVRRLPDASKIQLPRSPGRALSQNRPGSGSTLVSQISKGSALRSKAGVSKSAVTMRKAGSNARVNSAEEQSSRLMHHAPMNRTMVTSPSSMLADVMLNIGTLPAGESVTITFNVTVDDPFTGSLPQVSNQGTVSGSNFADVLTDDPSVVGTADPTVTPIDLPAVTLAVSPASVLEDGATNLVYTFTRTGSTANALTVNFSVGGTATFGVSPNDYTQTGATSFTPPTGTVTFGAGNSTATVTINPEADTTVEPDETVNLTVTSGSGYTVGSPSAASGTITNDDTAVSVAVAPGSVAEDGATNLVYTFTRNGDTSGALTVNFSVGGSATFGVSPNDYTQTGATTFTPPTGTVTFGAGNSTATVTIDPEADTTVETDETVDLTVTAGVGYNVGAPASASGTITNDDTDVSVAVAPGSVAEDGATNLVYTFTRNGVTTGALTVNFSVGGTATFGVSPNDYTQTGATSFTPPTGTVTFGAGNSTATVTIDPESDTTVEPDETVILTVTSGAGYNVGSPNSATGTITNDDTDVTLAVSPSSVSEDGATNLVYTFTRTGATASPLTVNFSVGGTASFGVSPNDYTQTGATSFTPPTGTVTFGAGNSTATVTVNPNSDTTVESDETVILTLTAGAGYNVGSPNSATGTITNDDADVTLAVSPSSVSEDGATNLVYTFTRSGFTASPLTVNFSVGGTATFGASPNDYTQTGATSFTPPTGTVTFGAGNSTATVTVNPETDTTVEADETVILTLTPGAGYNVGSPNSATGTITNDDANVSVVVAPSTVVENGAANLVYTFTRTGFTANAVTVNFSVGGTASFTQPDYSQTGAATFTATSGTVNFGPGSSTAVVTIDPTGDATAESDETVILTVTAGAGYNVGSPSSATGTILNDDAFVEIVFSSTRDGNFEIYGALSNGTGVTRLTNNSATDLDPALSLDKTKILFTSDRDGNLELYSMNVNGTGVTRLTNNSAIDGFGAWSPTGTQIVFNSTRDGNLEIYKMNSNGTGVTRLTNNSAIDTNPAWSPNGTKIAFTSTRHGNVEIYSMTTTGSSVTRLTNHSDEDAFPSWSPDSLKITFMSTRPGNPEIYSMNANGSSVTRLTNNSAIDAEPAWGTNGKIAFSTTRDGNFEIYSMNSNGTGLLRLTNNSAFDLSPHW
jgi:hypothetical protein